MFLYVIVSYVMFCHVRYCHIIFVMSYHLMSFLWFTMLYHVRLLAENEKRTGREEQKTHPRRFFGAAQACFKECFSKPIMRAFCLQRGGGGGAQPPPTQPNRFFKPCEVALKHLFETHHTSIVFANCGGGGRGAAPPPPPPKPPAALKL